MRKSLVAISALVVGVAVAVVATLYSPRANADTNLVEDPGFETSLSNFEPNQGGTSVNFTTNNPISGSRSLVVGTGGYGDSVLWNGKDLATFATKRSTQFSGSARIKATVASASSISLCGLVYYTNGQLVKDCREVTGSIGDKGTVSVNFALNNSQDIDRVRIGIFQEGSAALSGVMVDDVSVVLAGVSASNPTPTPTPVSGSCGTANNTAVSAAPLANLCATGTAGSVAGSGPWSWTCNGSNGGASASCSASVSQTPTPTPVNGVCGVANNTNVSSAPTSGLCSAGTAGSVAGSGPWSWSCAGTNGGTTASCSAQTVSAPVNFALTASKTGNGTITSNPAGINCGTTCSANYANNTSVTLTATAASGNTFSGWSGACTGTGTCTVSMTAARTVGATFVAQTTNPSPSVSGDNLVQEPGFELTTSDFEPNQGGTSVNATTNNPISGSRSLVIGIGGYGDSILWGGRDLTNFTTKRSDRLAASIKVRTTVSSASQISFCALVDYATGSGVRNCTNVSGAVGDKGTVNVAFALDNTRDVSRVRLGIFQEGSQALQGVMLDDATVVLNGITLPVVVVPAPTPVNGVCGVANNTTISAAPTMGLCSTGSASSVTGSGPWSWTCAGANGGTTASCIAQRTGTTPTPPVSTVFSIGQRVQTTANLNVRATAGTSGTLLGTQSTGALGTITAGPSSANNFIWWQVNYDSGADGYSAEDYLRAYSTPNPTPTPTTTPTPTPAPGSSMSFPAFNPADPADAPLIKFAETWARNWNFESHTVDPNFSGNSGNWNYTETTYEPWLFDRASVGYYLYKRTTDPTQKARWYQQFISDFTYYRTHIDSQGIFTPKGTGDTKYSYVTPFLLYEKETGDAQYRPIAQRIYNAWLQEFPNTYSTSIALWTEREIGLALEAAVSWYELTGDQGALTRANALVAQWTTMANAGNGVPLVTVTQHEGGGGNQLVTSPWMSALYFQAARRLNVLTGNTEVLQQVSRYADWMETNGYFNGSVLGSSYAGITAAYYLSGPTGPYTNETPAVGDFDHCLDVSGILSFAISAKQTLGQSTTAVTARNAQLRSCAVYAFTDATRTTVTLPKYRVNPPRKFNWWMRSTLGYVGSVVTTPTPTPTPTPTTTPTPATNYALSVSKVGNGTITSLPNGINCGTTCSANFANNTSVTLTATAASGNTFSGWSGACSGTGTCTVSMTAARTVGATFATPPATATVRPLATANPRVLLSDSATLTRLQSALTANTAGAARFRTMVNNELASPGTNYAFQGWFAALMYRLTGEARYATFAINKIDAFVTAEEARISGGMRPVVAGDSFLEVGDYVGDIALVYDWANDRLTQSQKTRWVNYMNTVLNNLWGDPDQVRWGGVNHPWSGWSLNDPFNNYYYSFLEATMFTGLATYGENPQAAQWLNKFYNEKIQAQLIPAFNSLPGGGSLEGTGYGTAQKRLFKLYFWWEKSTGVNIANQTPHTLGTMFWWANSMAPTLNKFVPTGDQSRDSTATFYDYHRELLENLMSLYPNEQVAGAIKTLLAQSNVPQMQHSVSFWSDFVNDWPAIPARPLSVLNTTYFGTGTGNLYTRSSWNTNAIFVHTIAGLYDQSHAHKDQGSFMLNVAGTWLFDDANLRSSSGIDGQEIYHNLVRIGSVSQREGSAPSQILAMSDGSLFTYELMNTRPVYTDPYTNQFLVAKSEREMLFIKSGAVVLFDRAAANTAGTPRTFQLQMSGTPTISGNQLTFTAGGQRADVWRLSPANVPWTTAGMFSGTRAEAVHSSGTESLFLHIIGVNNKVTSAVADNTATETGTRITFNDGTVATVRFSNAGRGGTLQIVNGSGVSQYNGALPTTVNTFPLYQ